MLQSPVVARIGVRGLHNVSPKRGTLDAGRASDWRDDHSGGRRDRLNGSRRRTRVGLGCVLAALLAVPCLAGDADVQRRIEQRLAGAELDHKADIRVSVADGAVRLTGIVLSYADYRAAERAARKEARSVVNLLRVVPETPRADRAVREDASTRVLRWDRYGPFDAVAVDVQDGVVLLHGWVDSPAKKDEIEERLAGVDGVRDVHNDLRVQGFSVADRQLLQQVYERIDGDPLFERWAGMPDPRSACSSRAAASRSPGRSGAPWRRSPPATSRAPRSPSASATSCRSRARRAARKTARRTKRTRADARSRRCRARWSGATRAGRP